MKPYEPTQSTYKKEILEDRTTFAEALALIATIIALVIIGIII